MSSLVLAISGSLRSPSFTERMLDLFIEGMGKGFDVRKFHPHRMDIAPCTGCRTCWGIKNPGACVRKDDFEQILDVYKQADYLLLAAPLYVFDFPATVKNVLDRFFIILEPALRKSERGDTEHPRRFGRHPKSVLLSSCGHPEIENFDILQRHFGVICEQMGWLRAGEILIPASAAAHVKTLFDGKYDLIRKAGRELIEEGAVFRETMAAVAAPVMPAEDYRRICTLSFESGAQAKAERAAIVKKVLRRQGLPD